MTDDNKDQIKTVASQPGTIITPGSLPMKQNESDQLPLIPAPTAPASVAPSETAAKPPSATMIQPVGLPRAEDQRVTASIADNTPPAVPVPTPDPVAAGIEVTPLAPQIIATEQLVSTESLPEVTTDPLPRQVSEARPIETDDPNAVSWTASEFIAHDKTTGWYAALVLSSVVVAAIVYLVTRDKITTGVIVVAALVLAGYGARKPRQLPYLVDSQGFTIGDKRRSFHEFRSFAVLPEGAFSSIVFLPLRRFATLATIYYSPQDEDKLIGIIGASLPLEERKIDPIDQLMRRIRF